jgi:uncharacterized protein YjbI with pentapeptide repeats
VVLALGGYLFARSENQRLRENADQQRTLDRELADERRQDDILQAYLDEMSRMLTDKERPLHRAELGDYLSTVARARTITTLSRLDAKRKGNLIQFLYEAGLINRGHPLVSLTDADLRGADLYAATLPYADLSRADLSRANLARADLSRSDLTLAKLRHANLREARLQEARLNASLSGANLKRANLRRAYLRSATLHDADLRNANLRNATLRYTNFLRAKLDEASLVGADLSNAKLLGATLCGADLTDALLRKAKLEATHFDRHDILMDEEDRDRLAFTSAELTRTNLVDADLSGTILTRADLLEAKINDQQLVSSASLEGAIMPKGQKYQDWRKTKKRRKENGKNE